MAFELSYLQLKTSNEARLTEEVQTEQRRKCLLILIRNHLEENGFLDTARVLEKEGGPALKKYDVCDNVDLTTVLQEYESYYYVKFKKQPKLIKKVGGTRSVSSDIVKGSSPAKIPPQLPYHFSLPLLPSVTTKDSNNSDSEQGGGGGGGGRRERKFDSIELKRKKLKRTEINGSDQTTATSLSNNNNTEGLGIEGSMCTTRVPPSLRGKRIDKEEKREEKKKEDISISTSNVEDRLLKPLAGFAGYNSDLRELATVISRDIYSENPNVKWNDIVGLEDAKRLVKEAVVYPIKYPQLFKGILSPWKGLLLYGPPGTGKTMLAKAVATECNTTFFNISASSIVSKWRGDSEKLVRVLFELARFHAPSTIFMDELESIMGQRSGYGSSGGEHEGSRRMKTELLIQMDGLSRSDDLVFLLAASNLPWDLDYAMLRRLEKRILVQLPTVSAREAMFHHYLPPILTKEPVSITSCVDYEKAAALTEGYSGSDIQLVCKEAAMMPLRKVFNHLESMSTDTTLQLGSIKVDPITTDDVELAVSHTKPSAHGLTSKYTAWQQQYEST